MDLPSTEPYEFERAVERIEAAADAARKLPYDFVLTARADGVMHGKYGLDEAIRRLQAFQKAGADVLFAPMPGDMDDVARICKEVDGPINAICAGPLHPEHDCRLCRCRRSAYQFGVKPCAYHPQSDF